jgi:hypothetical protein
VTAVATSASAQEAATDRFVVLLPIPAQEVRSPPIA